MEELKQKSQATQEPDGQHVVKMWTPFNIKVDETYPFIPTNKAFKRFSDGFKRFAKPVLAGIDKAFLGLQIDGRENLKGLEGKGFITVCNHVNIMDCTMIAVAVGRTDIVLTTIKENFEIPVVRFFVKSLGAIPIPRGVKAMQKFSEAIHTLLVEQHKVVHFYPEGVLFPYYNGLRGFHRGAFRYAVKNDVPIVPLVITYHKPKSKLCKQPIPHIHILKPIYPDMELAERPRIMAMKETVTNAMQARFDSEDCLRDNTKVLEKFQKQIDKK